MNNFFSRWIILTIGVLLATFLVPGIDCPRWPTLFAASLVLGILNTLAKPLLMALTFPFILVTFGLFIVIINAGLLLTTSWLLQNHGFYVEGLRSALLGSIVISLVTIVFSHPQPRRN